MAHFDNIRDALREGFIGDTYETLSENREVGKIYLESHDGMRYAQVEILGNDGVYETVKILAFVGHEEWLAS